MKVIGIALLAGTAAIGANAQVLKGTASSSNPRRRNTRGMKAADRRRLQEGVTYETIQCFGIVEVGKDGYGAGCTEEMPPVNCVDGTIKDSCSGENTGFPVCYDSTKKNSPGSPTDTCVCVVPVTGDGNTRCTHDFGDPKGSEARPCCYPDEKCLGSGINKYCEPPSKSPTVSPTNSPTKSPTDAPTDSPTNSPTDSPTQGPSESSAPSISGAPSQLPTDTQAPSISANPSQAPSFSVNPTQYPTDSPTVSPTKNPTEEPTGSPVTATPTKAPVTDKPTVDKKEILLLLLLLKLAFLDYLHDLIWKSSTTSSWSGDSWDKPTVPDTPDTPPTPPSGKSGKSGTKTGSKGSKSGFNGGKAGKSGSNGGKGSTASSQDTPAGAPKSATPEEPAPMSGVADDGGEALIEELLTMLASMGEGGRRTLEAVDVNGIKAKFMKRIQTTFNGRRDLEMMIGASAGVAGSFQDVLLDNKNVFESEDMDAVEAKLESLLNE